MNLRATWALAVALLVQQAAAQPGELTSVQALERARAAEAAGDHSTAGEMYLEMVKREPGDLQWVFSAADALLRAKRFDDTLDMLERARQRFPGIADIPTRIAKTYKLKADDLEAQGDRAVNVRFELEEAVRAAEDVLRQSPWERDARLVLAESQLRLGKTDRALAEADELVRRFPRDAAGHTLLGDIHYRDFLAHRERLAVEQLGDDDRQTLTELANAAQESAAAAYRMASSLDQNAAFPHAQLGHLFAWAEDVEQAATSYQRALARDPACGANHDWINSTLLAKRRAIFYRVAAEQYRTRPEASAAVAAVLDWYHAYARYELEEYGAAYDLFTAAIEANPVYLNSRCYAMLAAYWNGDQKKAELQAFLYAESAPKHFADTVRAGADQAQTVSILEFLARRSHDGGRMDRCCAISHVLARILDTERHWNNYAFLCRETKRFEESLRAYEAALEISPDSPQILNDTAVILHYHLPTEDNLTRAVDHYERAIRQAGLVLADAAATPQAKNSARTAKSNATNNLNKLRAQKK